jgi:adenine deaminase
MLNLKRNVMGEIGLSPVDYRLWSEIRVLMRICVPGEKRSNKIWEDLHNQELCNLYTSPNIISMAESKRMRRVVHEARMGDEKCTRKSEKIKEKGNLL